MIVPSQLELNMSIFFQIGYTIAGSFIFPILEKGCPIEVQLNAVGNRTLYARKLWNLTMDLNLNVKLREKDYRSAVDKELMQFQKVCFSNPGYLLK